MNSVCYETSLNLPLSFFGGQCAGENSRLRTPEDQDTKYSFLLLDQLAALLGGKVEKAGPLLTLPISTP